MGKGKARKERGKRNKNISGKRERKKIRRGRRRR